MKVRKIIRQRLTRADIANQMIAQEFTDRESDAPREPGLFEEWVLRGNFVDDYLAPAWRRQRSDFLDRWIEAWPGTRPVFFYMFDTELFQLPFSVEAEAAFLRKHGLLRPDEAARIPKKDFLPDTPIPRPTTKEHRRAP